MKWYSLVIVICLIAGAIVGVICGYLMAPDTNELQPEPQTSSELLQPGYTPQGSNGNYPPNLFATYPELSKGEWIEISVPKECNPRVFYDDDGGVRLRFDNKAEVVK